MKKLTFERAVLIVLVLIALISTSSFTIEYVDRYVQQWRNRNNKPATTNYSDKTVGIPTILTTANNYFREGNYEAAAAAYLPLTMNSALSIEQKIRVYFNLGACQYILGNYESAVDNFNKAGDFSMSDSVPYNNAAVSAYKAKDFGKAIEYQRMALKIRPAVEYYYNMARIYEDNEEYEAAISNYMTVILAEQNITQNEIIDPVRIKEKLAKLQPKGKTIVSSAESNAFQVYKLNNPKDVLLIGEKEMQLKSGDFEVIVNEQKGYKSIAAQYNRKANDPYNLITEVVWRVYKNEKLIMTKKADQIIIDSKDGGNYEVNLNIRYDGYKQVSNSKAVKINSTSTTIDQGKKDDTVVKTVVKEYSKTYQEASYEQLFESGFVISNRGNIDEFDVTWGKDSKVITDIIDGDSVDRKSSLFIYNSSEKDSGLWINLDSHANNAKLAGKRMRISFYASKMSEVTELSVTVRLKLQNSYVNVPVTLVLPDAWERKDIYFNAPSNMTGLTVSIATRPNQSFKMDGFTITELVNNSAGK